jgi:hypothetical protein
VNKLYFGITRAIGTAQIVGVVANLGLIGSRAPTAEETALILSKIKDKATESLADALRDGTYPNIISVWDKRADARNAIATLNSYDSPQFTYNVGEVGDRERSSPRPLGWRLMFCGGVISGYNHPSDGTTVFIDGDSSNKNEVNCLFDTRATARKVIKQNGLNEDYKVVRVDA